MPHSNLSRARGMRKRGVRRRRYSPVPAGGAGDRDSGAAGQIWGYSPSAFTQVLSASLQCQASRGQSRDVAGMAKLSPVPMAARLLQQGRAGSGSPA